MKEIRIRPIHEDKDYLLKLDAGIRFLGGGDQVRITVMLRGREQTHPERAEPILRKFAKDLESYAEAEFPLVFEERQVSLTFTPKIIA